MLPVSHCFAFITVMQIPLYLIISTIAHDGTCMWHTQQLILRIPYTLLSGRNRYIYFFISTQNYFAIVCNKYYTISSNSYKKFIISSMYQINPCTAKAEAIICLGTYMFRNIYTKISSQSKHSFEPSCKIYFAQSLAASNPYSRFIF